MVSPTTPNGHAERIVSLYTQGFIGPGEVWNQLCDHVTEETFSQFMTQLPPDLHAYLEHTVLVHHGEPSSEEARAFLRLLREWYRMAP